MHHPTDRIGHTTAFVTPVVEHWLEREIAQWVQPVKGRSDDPSHHERTPLPRSYIPLLLCKTLSLSKHVSVVRWLRHHFKEGSQMNHREERPLMVRWVIRSIPHGRSIELCLIPASAPRLD